MPTLQEFLDLIVEKHRAFYQQNTDPNAMLEPMVLAIAEDGSFIPILLDLGSDSEKQFICEELRKFFKKNHVRQYGFFSESWVSLYTSMNDVAVMPSKREDRKEIITTIVADNEGNKLASNLEMIRDWTTGQVIELKPYEFSGELSGRFAELLD